MARSRTLKIGFFKNETLAELDWHVRLMFAGLPLMCDREGRMEDRPRYIKAELFPYNDIDAEAALSQLAGLGFIKRYEAGGCKYLWIPNFLKHQRPHPHEPQSTIPAWSDHVITSNGEGTTSNETAVSNCALSLTVLQSLPSSPSLPSKEQQAAPVEYHPRFLDWWQHYPRKVGKSDAQAAWKKAGASLVKHRGLTHQQASEFLVEAAKEFAPTPLGQAGKYCPHPATWLNQARYDDDRAEWSRTESVGTGKPALFRFGEGT